MTHTGASLMDDHDLSGAIRSQTQSAWHRFLDVVIPFRPDLYRYCRRLTGNVWDADDLVQDTLLRAFGLLGSVHQPIDNPRGYLVRIATNLWIDALRRRQIDRSRIAAEADRPRVEAALDASLTASIDARDAGAILLGMPPRERAALLLKEVFDMTLEEIAETLATTVGAVKSALHRGRTRLRDDAVQTASHSRAGADPRPKPSAALIDRFVERLNAADLPGLLALMLDTAVIEMPGALVETGRAQ